MSQPDPGSARVTAPVPDAAVAAPTSRITGGSALVAGGATFGLGLFFAGMAVLALASGHGEFSGHIGVGLAVWGALVMALGVFALRRAPWIRGPLLAVGLLHLLAFGQSALVQPWALLGAAAALAAVLGALWSSVRRAGAP